MSIEINPDIEQVFNSFADKWKRETSHISSTTTLVAHPSYQSIIAMGRGVLPILFRELQQRPDYWFIALREITGENPIKPEDAGNLEKMSESWLNWAKEKGYF